MPNLVGTGNNQVPTNAMLGGMAYQDTNNVLIKGAEIENINAIRAKIADDARAVFIYDTSLDSDGGAWRKRVHNASWYEEPPGLYRGSRKDFPAVAVIVAESHRVTIYDGDDPNLPMWMVFRSSGYGQSAAYAIQSGSGSPGDLVMTDVHMLNGQLVVCQSRGADSYGSPVINIISERVVRMDPNSSEGGTWMGNIAQRNTNQQFYQYGGHQINNSQIKCCTQFVDPRAKIDPDTGLPRPTIFLGTAAGVSQIDSDETVRSDNSWGGSTGIIAMTDANSKGQVVVVHQNGNPIYTYLYNLRDGYNPAHEGAGNHPATDYYHYNLAVANYPSIEWSVGAEKVCWVEDSKLALLTLGVNLYLDGGSDSSTASNSLRCFAKFRPNEPTTGYLPGLNYACLCNSSDTDDLPVGGGNLLSNGTFTSNITGWNDLSGSGSSISHNSGNARMDLNGAVAYARAHTTFTTVVGKWYVVETLNLGGSVFGSNQELNIWVGTAQYPTSGFNSLGTGRYKHGVHDLNAPTVVQFKATTTTTHVVLESGWNVAVDNVYARQIDPDKGNNFMYNGNQLAHGAVPMGAAIGRTPYATGGELVTYNLTGGAYLEQPYNPNLNFLQSGSNDYTVMAWAQRNISSGWSPLISLDYWNGSKQWFCGALDGMALHGGDVGNTHIEANQLYFMCWTRKSGTNYLYLNGELDGSNTDAGGGAAATQTLVIGGRHANGQNNPNIGGSITDNNKWTKVALVRISQGALTADQVRDIYNSERQLFVPNAKSTLAGVNNYTRDLAYDKSTGKLHVLMNTARSDFNGLRLINSETRSAGTASIHAVNGMVVEEE